VYPPQKKLCLLSISAINFKQNKRMKSHFASRLFFKNTAQKSVLPASLCMPSVW
jgi:hypothetical protein